MGSLREGAEGGFLRLVNMDRITILYPRITVPVPQFGGISLPGYWMVLEGKGKGRCTDEKSSPAS